MVNFAGSGAVLLIAGAVLDMEERAVLG